MTNCQVRSIYTLSPIYPTSLVGVFAAPCSARKRQFFPMPWTSVTRTTLVNKSDFVAMKCEDFSSQTPLFLKAVIILFPGAIASKAPSLLFGIFMNKTLVYSSSVIFEFRVIFCPTVPIKVWEKSSDDVM